MTKTEIIFAIVMGAISVMIAIAGFLLKFWFTKFYEKLDDMVESINKLCVEFNGHGKDIEYIRGRQDEMHERLNSHSNQIRELQLKQK